MRTIKIIISVKMIENESLFSNINKQHELWTPCPHHNKEIVISHVPFLSALLVNITNCLSHNTKIDPKNTNKVMENNVGAPNCTKLIVVSPVDSYSFSVLNNKL